MADYTITVADVRDGDAFQTAASDSAIGELIAALSAVDGCLEGASVADALGKLLKKYAVRHMLALAENSGAGLVASKGTPIGASISYAAWQGKGLSATPYGDLITGLDRSGCFASFFDFGANVGMWSAG